MTMLKGLAFIAQLPSTLIDMEACGGAHYLRAAFASTAMR
jgi:hypothetical protein